MHAYCACVIFEHTHCVSEASSPESFRVGGSRSAVCICDHHTCAFGFLNPEPSWLASVFFITIAAFSRTVSTQDINMKSGDGRRKQ